MAARPSVAVVFDDTVRSDTTGGHCIRALSGLAATVHVLPSELSQMNPRHFDLFLRIDDGCPIDWPPTLRPSACWLIDTHIDFDSRLREAANFDFVFAAQRNGTQRLRDAGLSHAQWLPLACDPELHRRHDIPNRWDIGFIGNIRPSLRLSLISLLTHKYPRSFFGQAYGEELARTYSASHIGFNCAVSDDVNMRVFEAMACGVALVTNDLSTNGQADMFRDGVHLITYLAAEDLLDKLNFYLNHHESRGKIARQGQLEAHARHTYRHRMATILDAFLNSRSAITPISTRPASTPHRLADQIDIVIKSFLRPKSLLQLLRSIRKFYPNLQVTVVDDGGIETSTDPGSLECVAFLHQDAQMDLQTLPFDAGVSAGRNFLVEQTSRPFLLFLDDDFVFTEDTRIERLLDRLEPDLSLGAVAGVCVDVNGDSRVVRRSCGTLAIDSQSLVHDTSAWLDEKAGLCDYFPTFALVRRSLFEQGIKWRGGIGGEHYDFCLQLRHCGWKAAIDRSVNIDHDQQVQALPGYVERRFAFHAAQQALLQTWELQRIVQDGQIICELDHALPVQQHGVFPPPLASESHEAQHFQDDSYYHFVRHDVLNLVPAHARRILDVGCGAGRLGEAIKARQPAEVVGIEIVPAAAKAAETRLDKVYCMDVESDAWPMQHEFFDCVIVADVLEHLRHPERLLARIRKSLRPNGLLVASLPNTRNYSVVSSLLAGHWTYEAAGLLDQTHLRFFTRREIEKLFYRSLYELVAWQIKPDDRYEEWRGSEHCNSVRVGSLRISGLSPADAEEFHTYQFLISAKPAPQSHQGLTSIIILTHNQLPYTRMCLDSIRMRTDEPYELIIVDNASTDGTKDYLRSLKGVHVIENQENRGFPAGVNQGMRIARGQQVLLLNNDTIATTGWLRRMLSCLNSNPKIGLVGPTSNSVSGSQCVETSYDDLRNLDGFSWDWGKAHASQQIDTQRLVGFCLLARRSVVDAIGGLDERFGIGTFEDDDYCRRAIEAGYRCVIACDAFVHHFGSKSFSAAGVDAQELLARNQTIFDAKWKTHVAPGSKADVLPSTGEIRATHGARFQIESDARGAISLKRQSPLISLCMIVRDNERTLGAALKTIGPFVDEMVVVDTGSKDTTREIARSHGARVFDFPWPDSFAIARNESLRHARGEWLFWMDSDDTIPAECGRKLREVASRQVAPSVLGFIMQVHCPNAQREGEPDVTVVDHIKMFRNRPDLRFEGRIHEQIMPAIRQAGGETVWTDIFVVHSGSDQTEAGQKIKQQRDLRLLRMEAMDRPDHPFVLFNIGMTHADMGNHVEAVAAFQRSIEVSAASESHLRKAYALLAASHLQLDQLREAEGVCQAGCVLYPNDVELLFREGFIAHQLGQHERAISGYRRALEATDDRHFSSIDRGLEGYKTRHNLALVYEEVGKWGLAEEQWRLVVADVPSYRIGWRGLMNNLIQQKKYDRLAKEIDRVSQNAGFDIDVCHVRAQLATTRGNPSDALRELEDALLKYSSESTLLEGICQLLFEFGSPHDAAARLKELIALHPDNAAAWHNLGTTYLRLNDHCAAEDAFRTALAVRPDSAASHLYRGFALEQLGNLPAARAAWQAAIQAAPNAVTALEAQKRLGGVA